MLDNVAWSSLTGPHADRALGSGGARRYPVDVAPFAGLADPADPACWTDLRALLGPDDAAVVTAPRVRVPDGWRVVERLPGVQMVAAGTVAAGAPDLPGLRRLDPDDPADVAAMLDLTGRTRPGPFFRRTATLGTYLGVQSPDGVLVAMAGERLHPAGWTEVSAVCTDPARRGRGYAAGLVAAVVGGIAARGERAVLHTGADNARAVGLYEHLGFAVRTTVDFALVTQPGSSFTLP